MNSQECRVLRLAEYVDGELSGLERLHVSRHLEHCASCHDEARSLERVGDLLRHATTPESVPVGLEGLASSVVSRVNAERAQSWRALFNRAVEDWHWFLVGFGSVTAAFISMTFVSAVLHFGPAPQRADSVAALLSNPDWHVVTSQDGSMYVWTTPVRVNEEYRIALTHRERAEAAADYGTAAGLETEEDVVDALGSALAGSGKSIDLQSMSAGTRNHAEALFRRLKDFDAWTVSPMGSVTRDRKTSLVYRLRFVTNAEVTAKGL